MMVGLVMIGFGLALLALGKVLTQRAIETSFGKVDAGTVSRSTGTGVVPVRLSLMVLAAWALLLIGIVVSVAAFL